MMAYSVFVQIWLPDTPEVKKLVKAPHFGEFVQSTLNSSIQGYLASALNVNPRDDYAGKWPLVSASRIIEQVS